jgi:lysophospholipase L1-like esterase
VLCHGRTCHLLAAVILTFTVACASSPTAPSPTSSTGPNGQTTDPSSSNTQDETAPDGSAPAPPSATTGPLGATRFLAIGDSITFGTLSQFDVPVAGVCSPADPPGYAYPNVLHTWLNQSHGPQGFLVQNCGVPGEGTNGGLARLQTLLTQFRPQGLLLLEGINDLNIGSSIGQVVTNLETMVEIARLHNVTVFVANMFQTYPSDSPEPENRHRENSHTQIAAFNSAIAQMVSGRQNVYLVDLYHAFGNNRSFVGNDGLHPTEDGFERMALWFRATIEQVFAVRAGFQ